MCSDISNISNPRCIWAFWIKRYGPEAESLAEASAESSEILRLRKELKRVTEERDLLKKAAAYFASHPD